ncbi:MAG: hypothetical protein HETSPECPRED_005778 [Heterodermia speciosa]|uniref:Uncharacterized protein n=1 Tax=Heterodermia speciosa TaxID=116794 RepID=A0A8H3FQ74_9LECA|nr:MAG: hypothetical protein HETSPECPRED_005778 [Heterodermia speciosa]
MFIDRQTLRARIPFCQCFRILFFFKCASFIIKFSSKPRIEGLINTIYEAPILFGFHNVTTASGGTHFCGGTNGNANPVPGNTFIDALDAASKLAKFPFDGTYSAAFDDFFITSIDTSNTATMFWGLLVNYQFTKNYFLKVDPTYLLVKQGSTKTVKITDGSTGVPIAGAVIDGVTTDANENAALTFGTKGAFKYKAERSDSIRFNALVVAVV